MPKRISQNNPPSAGVPGGDLQAVLYGGLRGRLARGFNVLMGAADTLERYLSDDSAPELKRKTEPLLRIILQQTAELERLAANTAELALDVNLHTEHPLLPMDLTAYLRTLCENANRELACLTRPASVEMVGDWSEPVYLYGNDGLMNVLFANLFSNSVRAKADAHITLECTPQRRLLYRDDGPGLSGDACALLRGETASTALMRQSGTGLLLVAAYAAEMGWTLTAAADRGLLLTVELPPYDGPASASLHSDTAEDDCAACRQAACLRREFEATLT